MLHRTFRTTLQRIVEDRCSAGLVVLGAGEIAATWAVVEGRGGVAFGAHACATLFAFRSVSLVLEREEPATRRVCALAVALLVWSLPCGGALVFVWVLLPALRRLRAGAESPWLELDFPHDESGTFEPVPVWPIEQLLRESSDVDVRFAAVQSLRTMDAVRAVPLLRLALRDTSEDVRLLAFAILDRREQGIRRLLADMLDARNTEEAKRAPSFARLAEIEAALAHGYWELCYADFAIGDAARRSLDSAARHAARALELSPRGATAVLLARIRLRLGQLEAVRDPLKKAEHLGVARAVTAPLFAELSFRERRFELVRPYLERVPRAHRAKPGLAPVSAFWTSHAGRIA